MATCSTARTLSGHRGERHGTHMLDVISRGVSKYGKRCLAPTDPDGPENSTSAGSKGNLRPPPASPLAGDTNCTTDGVATTDLDDAVAAAAAADADSAAANGCPDAASKGGDPCTRSTQGFRVESTNAMGWCWVGTSTATRLAVDGPQGPWLAWLQSMLSTSKLLLLD